MNVADRLQVREDAGADHEGKQMHGDQNCGAGAEGDEQAWGICVLRLQLYLHHGNHCETRQESRGAAGGFELSSAQIQLSPGQRLHGVLVQAHSDSCSRSDPKSSERSARQGALPPVGFYK